MARPFLTGLWLAPTAHCISDQREAQLHVLISSINVRSVSTGLCVRHQLLPFHLLPAPHLPAQRPSRKKQTRHQMDVSASGCPPSGHCNTGHQRETESLCPSRWGSRTSPHRHAGMSSHRKNSGISITGYTVKDTCPKNCLVSPSLEPATSY